MCGEKTRKQVSLRGHQLLKARWRKNQEKRMKKNPSAQRVVFWKFRVSESERRARSKGTKAVKKSLR